MKFKYIIYFEKRNDETFKILVIYLIITIIVSGCSNIDNVKPPKETYTPKSLTVEFVPSQNAQILNAKVKPLQQLLSDELEVPVKVHIATNYNTMVEGLKSKKSILLLFLLFLTH